MNSKTFPVIVLVDHDKTLRYLFGRFAERSGFQLSVVSEDISLKEIQSFDPVVVIFSSQELLEKAQPLVLELTRIEIPILVCSSVTEEARARELGADYCLLHPITFEGFQGALTLVHAPKRA